MNLRLPHYSTPEVGTKLLLLLELVQLGLVVALLTALAFFETTTKRYFTVQIFVLGRSTSTFYYVGKVD